MLFRRKKDLMKHVREQPGGAGYGLYNMDWYWNWLHTRPPNPSDPLSTKPLSFVFTDRQIEVSSTLNGIA